MLEPNSSESTVLSQANVLHIQSMSIPKSVIGQDRITSAHLPEVNPRVNSHPMSSDSALFSRNMNNYFPGNGSSIHDQAALNGSTTARKYRNGHSIDGEKINGHTDSNSSTESHKYTKESFDDDKAFNNVQCHTQNPIAICGMSLRLPAGLKTPQELWKFLLAGSDARGRIPSSRYNVAAFHDPAGKHGTVITEYGYFLDEDLGALDTSFFSMPRMEVERTDPQQRLMLEATRECFEDAGEMAWRGKRIGCYMGSLGEDWCEMFAKESQNWGPYRYTGFGDFALSNRVSYEMDLQGPRFVYTLYMIFIDPN